MAHVHSSYCKGPKLSTTVLEPQAAAARHGASFFAPKGHRVERAVGKQDGGLDAPAYAEVRYGAPRLLKLPTPKLVNSTPRTLGVCPVVPQHRGHHEKVLY